MHNDDLSESMSLLRALQKNQHVHALYTDKTGKQEWFWAKVVQTRLRNRQDHAAGVLVAWLGEDRKVDKSYDNEYIPVYEFKRKLKLPDTSSEGMQCLSMITKQALIATKQIWRWLSHDMLCCVKVLACMSLPAQTWGKNTKRRTLSHIRQRKR